jgi:hypothetical protein
MWLKRYLDFPNWSMEYIATMPETHISDWARRNKIFMDKMYATEEREGGVDAVGDNIPAYQREDLSVYSPQEWETHKKELILESWADSVTATIKESRRIKK